jgi:hypothetical protein
MIVDYCPVKPCQCMYMDRTTFQRASYMTVHLPRNVMVHRSMGVLKTQCCNVGEGGGGEVQVGRKIMSF